MFKQLNPRFVYEKPITKNAPVKITLKVDLENVNTVPTRQYDYFKCAFIVSVLGLDYLVPMSQSDLYSFFHKSAKKNDLDLRTVNRLISTDLTSVVCIPKFLSH